MTYSVADIVVSIIGLGLIGAAAFVMFGNRFRHGTKQPECPATLPSAVPFEDVAGSGAASALSPAAATLETLVTNGPLIAWRRHPDGTLIWSGGSITVKAATVHAPEVTKMIAAREALRDQQTMPTGIERSRIEVSPPGCPGVPLHVTELPGSDGTIVGCAADATMAASAEGTLSRFVQTMTETFAHLTVGLAIFDRNRTLAMFNPALVQMWKADPSWLACRPSIDDILEELRLNRRIPEKGDFREWRDRLTALFEDTEHVQYEEVWHLADGSTIRVLARPHPHGSLAFVFDDVTEQMKLEQRYRHSIDLRRATIDRLDEGIAVFGPDGLLQFVNAAFHDIWGTESEALPQGTHAREVLLLCRAASIDSGAWERLNTFITAEDVRRPWSARLTLGSGRMLSLRVASMPDGSSMIIFADITDSERIALALRERNEALEAAEEMRTAVLDRLSQRLRTPLNTLFGYGQMISDARAGPLTKHQQNYASGIMEAAGQLLDTIDDVTELAALQIEPLHDEGAQHDVWHLLDAICDLLQKRAIEAGAQLSLDVMDGSEHIACDLPALRQIAFNLAADAVHRAAPGREIRLSARAERGTLEVFTIERGGDEADPAQIELSSLTRALIRRQAERAGGTFEIGKTEDGVICTCRFPGILGLADPPAPDPQDEEMEGAFFASIDEG